MPTEPETDSRNCEPVEELRSRLTRGGLSLEAVEKATKAYVAGDVHALNLVYVGKHLTCPIPEELLTRVFPILTKASPDNVGQFHLDYEINRHRGGVQSITIRYPNLEEDVEPTEPEKPAATTESPGFTELPERKEAPAETETGAPPDEDDDWMRGDDPIDEIG